MMVAFDMPAPATTVGRRNVSNVPAQALILLNDPFVDEQALAWARRGLKANQTPSERIGRLYEATLARPPEPSELAAAAGVCAKASGPITASRRLAERRAGLGRLAARVVEFKEFLFLR